MVTLAPGEAEALTERVKILRERFRTAKSRVCSEKSRLYTEAWKESEGEALDIRWARMFERFVTKRTITIRDHELIVGSQSRYVIGDSPELAYDADLAKGMQEASFTMRGETETGNVAPEDRQSILEDAAYWAGKSVRCQIRKRWQEIYGDKLQDMLKTRVFALGEGRILTVGSVDWPQVPAKGLRAIIGEAEMEINRLTFTSSEDMQKYHFLRAVIISLEASILFARRHAAMAREIAERESDLARKRELEEIAQVCERVPEWPATSFREAVQSFWFTYLCAHFESPSTPGRLDQYLYPYFKKDIDEGRITLSQAAELLGCLWIKLNELTQFQGQFHKELSQGELFQYVSIGGLTPDGKDATNELSSLILEVARQIRLTQPAVAVVYHPNISEEFLIQAIETNRDIGGGIPAFLNGGDAVDRFKDYGVSMEDARDIHFGGCVHPHSTSSYAQLVTVNLNTPKMFEFTLHNGLDPNTGKQLGPETGDPRTFGEFEELLTAFKQQYIHWIDWVCRAGNVLLLTKMETCRVPFHSALSRDCIHQGRDVFSGGLKHRQDEASYNARGMQNVANSLVALKKLVFEDKRISMEEVLAALRSNFEGQEELRQLLLQQPKWGNDEDEADSVHAQIWEWTGNVCRNSSLRPWLNMPVVVRRGGATWHYISGKSCGAFPDGRRAGEPMGDGNVSAVASSDRKGPTAVINSASKLNQKASLSNLFNMKFPPYLLKTDENKRKLLALIKTYFDRGGYHIQFNMIGRDVLLDAKAHPENYRDLVVRIAGFSAYFVDLAPAVQDDIIARTEHTL